MPWRPIWKKNLGVNVNPGESGMEETTDTRHQGAPLMSPEPGGARVIMNHCLVPEYHVVRQFK
ncbi:hypothetical protein KCP71_18225 [Salmonella enterica subsp. enterica]|nr:hypothetical protein KCP71_18225 [Salmonella enterica subsp. enterica]